MTFQIKRLVKGKKGMEALQSILILAAGFVIVKLLKSLGGQAGDAGKAGIDSLFSGTGGS